MSYDQKIQSLQKVIEDHNSNADVKVDFEGFLKKLRDLGGTSDLALKSISWEDLERCGAPIVMARALARLFRKDSDDNGGKSAYISPKKAATLSFKELLERYNPRDSKSSVGKRLKDLSDGKPCIVFGDDNEVIVGASLKLLEDLIEGLPAMDTAFVEERPRDIFKIGDRPDFFTVENPLYPGEALRSEETCTHTGRSWKGVDIKKRQLLWIAIEKSGELSIDVPADAIDVLDRVIKKECTLGKLRGRYPQASKMYDEDSKIGKLPLLKISMAGAAKSGSGRGNNPFGKNITY